MTATSTRTVRAAIYVRISTDRIGAGLGVQRQEDDCRLLATMLGWDVVAVYVDNDMSAYSGRPRRRYLAMLSAIDTGEIDAVLAWHTDRLHRSPAELERYITVCEQPGRSVPTHCVKAGLLDLSTPAGRLVARQLGAVARYESEHMAERVRAQKAAQRAQGARLGGGRPFGYERDGLTVRPAEAALIVDATEQVTVGTSLRSIGLHWDREAPRSEWTGPMVATLLDRDPATLTGAEPPVYAEARERVAGGETPSSVACDLTDRAVPTGKQWTGTSVRMIVCNARNAGLIEHEGELITAVWPAIVTEDAWRAARAVLTAPERKRGDEMHSLRWVGSALYRCGACGGASDMRNAGTSQYNGTPVTVYRCRAEGHCSIPAAPVDHLVLDVICQWLAEHGANLLATGPAVDVVALGALANTHRARLSELMDEFEDDKISKSEYYRMRDRRQAKLDAVERQLATATAGSALTGIADAPDPVAAFRSIPVDRQRAAVAELMTVTIHPGKRGRVDLSRVEIRRRGDPADQPQESAVA